jgi:feruloyl-CoA synthase
MEKIMTDAPRAKLNFAPAAVEVENLDGGGMILRSTMALGAYADSLGVFVRQWSTAAPDRTFLAERDAGDGWRTVSYGETRKLVEGIGQALIDRRISPDSPVMLLSDNGIDNGLLQLASMYVGIPVVPISPAYSLMSQDYAKLKYIFSAIEPKLVFAANGKMYERALGALDLSGVEILVSENPPEGMATTAFSDLVATKPGALLEEAFKRVGPDTVAKILFTSGSTGIPKGVNNTQRMLCSNQQAIAQMWPFLEEKPPVTVDWLPWNHTFGGNHNFNMILRNGGTLYIDNGKPVPGLIEKTVATLREVSPTLYFNVPRGFDMLIPYLEQDARFRETFFRNVDTIFYAAAALPQNLWERLEKLSVQSRGEKVVMTSAWGATETSPMVTSVHFPIDRAGVIGLPGPGTELKFVPNAGKLEMRVRGPNVTPGYYKRDDLTQAAFDEDGFYMIGDAGKLADPEDPAKGVVFDGRTAEDFKLTSGTWVHVGGLRVAAIAAGSPVIQDVVVTGHNREELGLLIFPNPAGCAKVAGKATDTPLEDLIAEDSVREVVRKGLAAHNANNSGSSTRIKRALLMEEPPSIDANEITDKGYLNQRAVLERRSDLVEALYGAGGAGLICFD